MPDDQLSDDELSDKELWSDNELWSDRAAAAERAVLTRHLRRLWSVPCTALGVVGWPPNLSELAFVRWHYWWQAHLLDCLVDAHLRSPDPLRASRIRSLVRTHRLRNGGRWTNGYNDDMAWWGLAVHRAQTCAVAQQPAAVRQLGGRLLNAWSETEPGMPWRVGDDYRNTPTNGPAAILLTRLGRIDRGTAIVGWLRGQLLDAATGLMLDGLHPGRPPDREIYTYCQGVVLGALTELALRSPPQQCADLQKQAADLVAAIDKSLTSDGVLVGHDGGNAGLFGGILARYLALVVRTLPQSTRAGARAVVGARGLLIRSAAAAWTNRAEVDGLPLFGPDWSRPARVPTSRIGGRQTGDGALPSAQPERDLSVQLSGWMLLEATASVCRGSDGSLSTR